MSGPGFWDRRTPDRYPGRDHELTDRMRRFMGDMREEVDKGGPDDPIDRVLAAATMLLGAAVLLWPPGSRKMPSLLALLSHVGRELWKRRNWWVP